MGVPEARRLSKEELAAQVLLDDHLDEVKALLTDQVPDHIIARQLAQAWKTPRQYVLDLIPKAREEMAVALESIPVAHARAQIFSGVQRAYVDARLRKSIMGQLAATSQMANLLGLNASVKVSVAGAFGVLNGPSGPQMRELPLGTLGFNQPTDLAGRIGELEDRLREQGMQGLLPKAPVIDIPGDDEE